MSDSFIRPGGLPVPAYVPVATDNATILGDGSYYHPLSVVAPVGSIVFRPGDPQGTRGNVYTTWAEAYAAISAVRGRGTIDIEFDDRFVSPAPAVIPAGVYNMTDTRWRNVPLTGRCFLELADGVLFTVDPPVNPGETNAIYFVGYGFSILFNGTDPENPAPFTDISVLCGGNNVRFTNSNADARPMFRVTSATGNIVIIFDGAGVRGGLGDFGAPLLAPLVDVNGQTAGLIVGGGLYGNGAFTDSSISGGGALFILLNDDSAVGDFYDLWDNPAFALNGGITFPFVQNNNRYQLFDSPPFGVVGPADSPYPAAYNEFVLVDTTVNPVTITAPTAEPAVGERFTVKDVGGHADSHPITISPQGFNTIELGTIDNPNGSKTWVCDGLGHWYLVAAIL